MISVIVPVYNVEKYLHKCVDSIINQTYKDLEIILVDDGSPDNCPKICDEYAQKDNRIKVIHKENGGLSSARNVGMKMAKGDYIAFVDSDDYIEEHMYEKLLDALKGSNADFCMCGDRTVNENGEEIIRNNFSAKTYFIDEIIENFVLPLKTAAWNKLYKREYIGENIFPEGRIHGEDLVFQLSLLTGKTTMCVIPDVCYNYVKHSNSITTSGFSARSFDEVWCKDKAYSILVEKFNKYKNKAIIWRINARLNVIRKLVINEKTGIYKNEIKEYNHYIEENYKKAKTMLGKRKIEYFLYKHSKFLYKKLIKKLK